MKILKRYSFAVVMCILAVALGVGFPEKQGSIVNNMVGNVREMVSIVPAIYLLIGLADVYVPRETVVRYMGEKSVGIGAFLAIVMGSLTAGPLYAAFPVASIMLRKGASFFSVMVFLGAWSTLKVPMFLFETTSLGASFSITRWITSVFAVLLIAIVVDWMVPRHEKDKIIEKQSLMQREGTISR